MLGLLDSQPEGVLCQVCSRRTQSSEAIHAASEHVCVRMCVGHPPTLTMAPGPLLQDFLGGLHNCPRVLSVTSHRAGRAERLCKSCSCQVKAQTLFLQCCCLSFKVCIRCFGGLVGPAGHVVKWEISGVLSKEKLGPLFLLSLSLPSRQEVGS